MQFEFDLTFYAKSNRNHDCVWYSWWWYQDSHSSQLILFQAIFHSPFIHAMDRLNFPGGSDCKASAYNAGNLGSIAGLGRSPGEGNGNPLQYSCLENPMNGGAW